MGRSSEVARSEKGSSERDERGVGMGSTVLLLLNVAAAEEWEMSRNGTASLKGCCWCWRRRSGSTSGRSERGERRLLEAAVLLVEDGGMTSKTGTMGARARAAARDEAGWSDEDERKNR